MTKTRTHKPARGFIIAGMHRSGTSALTRVLSLMGATLPAKLMPADGGSNTRGFWEGIDVVDLNERLLAKFGLAWDDARQLPRDWLAKITPEVEEATRLIRSDFRGVRSFVIKDPRICRVLPLWIKAVRRTGALSLVVLAFRHPFEVARSLAVRDGFPQDKSLLLWLRHVTDAEKYSRGQRRALIDYGDLLTDWRSAIRTLYADLGLRCPWAAWTEVAIDRFLDPELRHHSQQEPEAPAGRLGEMAMTVYEALRGRRNDLSATCSAVYQELDTLMAKADPRGGSRRLPSQSTALAARLIREVAIPQSECLRRHLTGGWYLQQNPDIQAAGVDPYEHWVSTGADEGRLPSPDGVALARELIAERERAMLNECKELREWAKDRDRETMREFAQLKASMEQLAEREGELACRVGAELQRLSERVSELAASNAEFAEHLREEFGYLRQQLLKCSS